MYKDILCAVIKNIHNLMPKFESFEDACEYAYGHRNLQECDSIKLQYDCLAKFSTDLAGIIYHKTPPGK